jgi:predicted nucleic acid-binding Zn ribbon protein
MLSRKEHDKFSKGFQVAKRKVRSFCAEWFLILLIENERVKATEMVLSLNGILLGVWFHLKSRRIDFCGP